MFHLERAFHGKVKTISEVFREIKRKIRSQLPEVQTKFTVKLNNLSKNLSRIRRFPLNTVERDQRIVPMERTTSGSIHVRVCQQFKPYFHHTSFGGSKYRHGPVTPVLFNIADVSKLSSS